MFTHYLVLSRHFWLTCVCLKSSKDHFMVWHAFSNYWGRRTKFSLFHPRQWWILLEGFFFVPILCNCHKESPFVLLGQLSSIDLNNGLAILKPFERKWNFTTPSTIWPWLVGIGSVSFSTTIPRRYVYIACNNLGKSWYNFFQLS